MRTLKSVRNYVFGRFTLDQMIAAMVFATVATQLLQLALDVGATTPSGLAVGIVTLAWGGIYFRFFFKEEILYNSKAMIMYLFTYVTGGTELNKYIDTEEFISKKFPVKRVHKNGMIEFKKGQYGVLMTQTLPNVPPQRRPAYLAKTADLVNSLPLGLAYKSMHFCNIETAQPLVEQVRNAINDPDTTEEMRAHLYDSYKALSKVAGRRVWSSWGFVAVGKFKDADAAYTGSKVPVETIMRSLREMEIIPTRMTREYDIINVYRQMMSMKVVF